MNNWVKWWLHLPRFNITIGLQHIQSRFWKDTSWIKSYIEHLCIFIAFLQVNNHRWAQWKGLIDVQIVSNFHGNVVLFGKWRKYNQIHLLEVRNFVDVKM